MYFLNNTDEYRTSIYIYMYYFSNNHFFFEYLYVKLEHFEKNDWSCCSVFSSLYRLQ